MRNITLSEPPFLSIQGEGQRSGRPTVFIRTYICPLRCSHCDSKNTWGTGKFGDQKFVYGLDHLIEAVKKFFPVMEICITGGEPMIEGNGAFFKEFQWEMHRQGYSLTIETSGTIFNTAMLRAPMNLWSICPHFPCEMTGFVDWVNYPVLDSMINKIKPNRLQIKMLISNDKDLQNGKEMLKKLSIRSYNKLIEHRIPIIINPDCESNWVQEVYSPKLEGGFKTTAKHIPTTVEYLDAIRKTAPIVMKDVLLSQFNIQIMSQFHKLLGVV
jgi:pyruvate-formate lyase-activating enzyme